MKVSCFQRVTHHRPPAFHPRRFLTTPSLHCSNVVLCTPVESGQEADSNRGAGGALWFIYYYFLGRVLFKVGTNSGRIFSSNRRRRSVVKPSILRLVILLIIALFNFNCLASSA